MKHDIIVRVALALLCMVGSLGLMALMPSGSALATDFSQVAFEPWHGLLVGGTMMASVMTARYFARS